MNIKDRILSVLFELLGYVAMLFGIKDEEIEDYE